MQQKDLGGATLAERSIFTMRLPESIERSKNTPIVRFLSDFYHKGLLLGAKLHPFGVLMKIGDVIGCACRVKNVETARISYSGDGSTRQKL